MLYSIASSIDCGLFLATSRKKEKRTPLESYPSDYPMTLKIGRTFSRQERLQVEMETLSKSLSPNTSTVYTHLVLKLKCLTLGPPPPKMGDLDDYPVYQIRFCPELS